MDDADRSRGTAAAGATGGARRRRRFVGFPAAGGPCCGCRPDSLLTLQQVDEPTERDRAARRRGQALLGALGRLQLLLLVEGDPVPTLAQLRSLAEGAPAAADPALAAAIDQVVLRARIELARRGG